MEQDTNFFGQQVKHFRTLAGLSQQELAVKAGLSISAITSIEQGSKSNPRLSTILAIANALDVTLDALARRKKRKE